MLKSLSRQVTKLSGLSQHSSFKQPVRGFVYKNQNEQFYFISSCLFRDFSSVPTDNVQAPLHREENESVYLSSEGLIDVSKKFQKQLESCDSIIELMEMVCYSSHLLENEHILYIIQFAIKEHRELQELQSKENPFNSVSFHKFLESLLNKIRSFGFAELAAMMHFLQICDEFPGTEIKTRDISAKIRDQVTERLKSQISTSNVADLVTLLEKFAYFNLPFSDITLLISKSIKTDPALVTPSLAYKIIEVFASRQALDIFAFTLIQKLTTFHREAFMELSLEEKAPLFRNFAWLELQTQPPEYEVPFVMYALKKELQKMLDQLSEKAVIQVLEAYQRLPRDFPADFLDDVRESIIVTIQSAPSKLSTEFILGFLSVISELPTNKQSNLPKLKVVLNELSQRLGKEKPLQSAENFNKMIQIVSRFDVKDQTFSKAVSEYILNHSNTGVFFNGHALFMIKATGINVVPIIQKTVNQEEFFTRTSEQTQLQAYVLMKATNEKLFEPQINRIWKTLLADKANCFRYGNYLSAFRSKTKVIEDEVIQAIQSLSDQFENLSTSHFWKIMLENIVSTKTKVAALESLAAQGISFDKTAIAKLAYTLQNHPDLNLYQALFFINFIRDLDLAMIPWKIVIGAMISSKRFFEVLAPASESLFFLINFLLKHKEEIIEKVPHYYLQKFSMKLNAEGYAKNAFDKAILVPSLIQTIKRDRVLLTTEAHYISYALSNEMLTGKEALELFQVIKDPRPEMQTAHANLIFYAIRKGENNSDLQSAANNIVKTIEKRIAENQHVPSQLAILVSMPPKVIQAHRHAYSELIRKNLNGNSKKAYMNIITQVPSEYCSQSPELYHSLFNILAEAYPKYQGKLSAMDKVRVLDKLSEANYTNYNFYKTIVEELPNIHKNLKPHENVRTIVALANLGVAPPLSFDYVTKQVVIIPKHYKRFLRRFLASFYATGYQSDIISENIEILINSIEPKENGIAVALLQYLLILRHPQEQGLVKKIFAKLSENGEKVDKTALLYDYFNTSYPQTPEYAKILKAISLNFEQQIAQYNEFIRAPTVKSQIGEYLAAAKIEHVVDAKINETSVDVFLPRKDKGAVVRVYTTFDYCGEGNTLRGPAILTDRILHAKLKDNYVIIKVNLREWLGLKDHQKHIEYLTRIGLMSEENAKNADFSKLEKKYKRIG